MYLVGIAASEEDKRGKGLSLLGEEDGEYTKSPGIELLPDHGRRRAARDVHGRSRSLLSHFVFVSYLSGNGMPFRMPCFLFEIDAHEALAFSYTCCILEVVRVPGSEALTDRGGRSTSRTGYQRGPIWGKRRRITPDPDNREPESRARRRRRSGQSVRARGAGDLTASRDFTAVAVADDVQRL